MPLIFSAASVFHRPTRWVAAGACHCKDTLQVPRDARPTVAVLQFIVSVISVLMVVAEHQANAMSQAETRQATPVMNRTFAGNSVAASHGLSATMSSDEKTIEGTPITSEVTNSEIHCQQTDGGSSEEQEQARMLERSVMQDCERDVGMVVLGGVRLRKQTRDKHRDVHISRETSRSPFLSLPPLRNQEESSVLSVTSSSSSSSPLVGKDSPLVAMQEAAMEEEEARFRTWYFGKLLYAQTFIFMVTLGVYVMCLPEDDAHIGEFTIRGRVIFSLGSGVYALFCVAIGALLAVRQLPCAYRGKAVAASLIPFPCTCLMYVLVYSHAPVEVTRKRLMHIQWGGWEQKPLYTMPALLAAAFIGMGFKSTLTSMAILRPKQQRIIPLLYAACIGLTFGHCYHLTGERTALDLMALTVISYGLGCYVGWKAESLTRRLWISSERANQRLQNELKAKEAEFADLADLRFENMRLMEQKERAVMMMEAQARRRLSAESRLRKVQRGTRLLEETS